MLKQDKDFLKRASNLINKDQNLLISHENDNEDDKIQNYVPVFKTNNNRRAEGDYDDREQRIIEINGKRYLIVQELDPPQDGDALSVEEDE